MKKISSIPVETSTAFYTSLASLQLCAAGQRSGKRRAPFIHVNLQALCSEENLHLCIRLFATKLTHLVKTITIFVV